jgi:hypothetical protein
MPPLQAKVTALDGTTRNPGPGQNAESSAVWLDQLWTVEP